MTENYKQGPCFLFCERRYAFQYPDFGIYLF